MAEPSAAKQALQAEGRGSSRSRVATFQQTVLACIHSPHGVHSGVRVRNGKILLQERKFASVYTSCSAVPCGL